MSIGRLTVDSHHNHSWNLAGHDQALDPPTVHNHGRNADNCKTRKKLASRPHAHKLWHLEDKASDPAEEPEQPANNRKLPEDRQMVMFTVPLH